MVAYAPGYAVAEMEIDELFDDLENPGEPIDAFELNIQLRKGLVLHGRVVRPSGQPLEGVRVGLAPDTLELDVDEVMTARCKRSLSRLGVATGGRLR